MRLNHVIAHPHRGMVVSVFFDPGGSDEQTLQDLEHGNFGPYFLA